MTGDEGNVALFNTSDGGEILIVGGLVDSGGGLEAAVFLSLFGNNNDGEWWGNLSQDDPARQYPGETQKLIDGLPARPSNLLRIQDAVTRDLEPLIEAGVFKTVDPEALLVGPKRLRLRVTIDGDTTLEYELNWEADRAD